MALKHLITCVIAGIDYLIHPQILGSVEENVKADQIIPVVVLSEKEVNSGPEELGKILQYLVDNDDVCTDEFTGIIVVKPEPSTASSAVESGKSPSHANSQGPDLLSHFASVYHMVSQPGSLQQEESQLPSGPYFLSGQNLHQAWRLYPDDLEAFTFGLMPDDPFDPRSFRPVTPQSSNGLFKTIPVPSRLYHRPDPKRPLAGARVSVKDIFDVAGVKTTLSSRAWAELYPAVKTSAPYVKRLLDQGAIIVGKTKTTQFAAAAAAEWVDFQSPVNPRGDGYQRPSGSSTGAATSLAGYPWLDYAVGADSVGGVIEPAAYHGLHALRPTFGSTSLEGIKINSPQYDTVGLFGRSLDDLTTVVNLSLDISHESKDIPRRILYPTDFFPLPDPAHQKLVENFIEKLEAYLGVKRVEISLAQLWGDKPPSGSDIATKESLQGYMKKAPFWSLCYDYFRASDRFRSDYRRTFDREPFVEASPRFRWSIGANVTEDEYDMYLSQIDIFKTWFDATVMSSNGSSHDALMILPFGTDGPEYRDVSPKEPTTYEGINPKLLSPVLGTPHLVVPFAQIPYESRISGTTEYRPICAHVMGTRGSDLVLIRLVQDALDMAGWRTDIDTGRLTFPLGENNRNVDDQHKQMANSAADHVAPGIEAPVDEL